MPFTVIAIISAYNEADVIRQVVGDLIAQGVRVYLIDHASTDGTVKVVESFLGKGLLRIERFPDDSGAPREEAERFAWERILRRKEALAQELESSWFIHADADELRESPWPDKTLLQSIEIVDRLGYNAIDFAVFNFWPTHDRFRAGDDLRESFHHYLPASSFDERQIKCWKKLPSPVDLVTEGGHEARFPGRKVFPVPFLLRHYPIRSQAHGERKIFQERRPRIIPEERQVKQWHVQYDGIDPAQSLIHDPNTLIEFDPVMARIRLVLTCVEQLEHRAGMLEESVSDQKLEERLRDTASGQSTEILRLEHALQNQAKEVDELTHDASRSQRLADERLQVIVRLEQDLDQALRSQQSLRGELDAIYRSISWKTVIGTLGVARAPLKLIRAQLRRLGFMVPRAERRNHAEAAEEPNPGGVQASAARPEPLGVVGASPVPDPYDYDAWVRETDPSAEDLARSRDTVSKLAFLPTISILMPIYNVEQRWLERAIASVSQQTYERWELCLVDDGSTLPYVAELLRTLPQTDPRIKSLVRSANGGIVAASSDALTLATGEFVALLDHDDEIAPHALAEVVQALQDHEIDYLYTDEDKFAPDGRRVEYFFKPDWSPELLESCNYACHLSVIRRSLLLEVGGFRRGFDGSQDYDLILRVTEKARRIHHIPQVLYHWRMLSSSAAASNEVKPYAYVAGQRALAASLERRQEQGDVTPVSGCPGWYRTRRAIVGNPKVTIIIPTRDRADLLSRCTESLSMTSYRDWEVLIVDNGSIEGPTLELFDRMKKDRRFRILRDERAFNFSALNNVAVRATDSPYVLFLNNDTEVCEPQWLSSMLEHAQRDAVGAVGARLVYPDRSLQHAGVVLGAGGGPGGLLQGVAVHLWRGWPALDHGLFNFVISTRDVSAVTAACLLMRRSTFDEIGGFNERLACAYNDIDLCLRIRQRGYRIVYTPWALLIHHESASRGASLDEVEVKQLIDEWGPELLSDPYYSPNFSLIDSNAQLRFREERELVAAELLRRLAQHATGRAYG